MHDSKIANIYFSEGSRDCTISFLCNRIFWISFINAYFVNYINKINIKYNSLLTRIRAIIEYTMKKGARNED